MGVVLATPGHSNENRPGSLDDVHIEARHNKLRQTERANCPLRVGSVRRRE
jgi:hypothetical protein